MFVSDKMKTINRTVSPDVSNHIYLDFGDGLMGGIKCNKRKKKLTKFSCVFVFTSPHTLILSSLWLGLDLKCRKTMRASVHFHYDSKNVSRLVCGTVKR